MLIDLIASRADAFPLLWQATLETLYMVAFSGGISFILGIPLGVLLYGTKKQRLLANPPVHAVLDAVVNIMRSLPFVILMVAIMPLTHWIVGSSIGTNAAMVPLTLAATPFVARLTEGALLEVFPGLIEAGHAMGATPVQIIGKILLPEALPGMIHGMTLTLIALINYSAMAGAVGGGGLGDLGIRYGYQRFDGFILLCTVFVLILMTQLLQFAGDRLSAHYRRCS